MIPENLDPNQEEELPEPMYRPETTAQSISSGLYGWLQPILFALTVLFLISTFLGRLIGVKGSSMVPTLHDKDMLLLQSIGYSPKAGDIVVLSERSFEEGTPIVKRVIATEGQVVDIDYDSGTVYVDGVALDEPYLGEPMREPTWETTSQHFEVPEGHIFVLGDNRNNSTDSRDPRVGMVDVRCVLGRAIWRLIPFGGIDG